MAKKPNTRKARRKKRGGGPFVRLLHLGALIALVGIIYSAWFWIDMRSWRPDEGTYPEQGAQIATGSAGVRFETLKATGADFVYLELGGATAAPDPGFRERFGAAREAGLRVGIVHPFDPCLRADPQSARFTRMVARDEELLPPAIALIRMPDECDSPVSEAAVTSEVLTLVNQIEAHAGQPAIIKLGTEFEQAFRIAGSLDRDLWLMRDRSVPRYAGRPWLLWSANSQLVSEATGQPIEWVVVQR